MDEAREQAREQFARLRGQVQPHLNSIPAHLQKIPNQLQKLPERFPLHSRSRSSDSAPLPRPLSRAPSLADPSYNYNLADLASKILYRSGIDPVSGGPLLILCASAFPDANEVDYNRLLPYVLSNLPGDDELAGPEDGGGYSVIFFAGGNDSEKKNDKGNRPTWAWTLQAYHLLGRAVRKKIKKLWVVHEKAWVRALFEIMAGVVSVKFRKKVVHLNTLTDLAKELDITKLDIPPAVFLHDRKLESTVTLPGFPPLPIFGQPPFNNPTNPPRVGDHYPLPQVLVDTTTFIRQACLEVPGLFRIPASQALLEAARDCYDRRTRLRWEEWGPHTAAGLIKLYYRSLPEPMIPSAFYPQIMSLVAPNRGLEKGPSPEDMDGARFEVVRSLLSADTGGLPVFSRVLFIRHLFPLLAVLASHCEENKMTTYNLAVCIAGSLFRSEDVMADAKAQSGIRKFVEIGIERIEKLAPKLPLRRGGIANTSARKRANGSAETPGSRMMVIRKQVPKLMVPSWENPDNKLAVTRKQVPMTPTDGSFCQSPIGISPQDYLPMDGIKGPTENLRQSTLPIEGKPPTQVLTIERANTYESSAPPPPPAKLKQYQMEPQQARDADKPIAVLSPTPPAHHLMDGGLSQESGIRPVTPPKPTQNQMEIRQAQNHETQSPKSANLIQHQTEIQKTPQEPDQRPATLKKPIQHQVEAQILQESEMTEKPSPNLATTPVRQPRLETSVPDILPSSFSHSTLEAPQIFLRKNSVPTLPAIQTPLTTGSSNGTFNRPVLRRVASLNFPSSTVGSNSSAAGKNGEPGEKSDVFKKLKKKSSVRELSKLYEERVASVKVLAESRKSSTTGL